MNTQQGHRPLEPLGLASEARLGNELWKLHQQWMYEDNPKGGDEVLASQAALGRQVNQLLLGWMDRVLAREGVRKDQAEMLIGNLKQQHDLTADQEKTINDALDWLKDQT